MYFADSFDEDHYDAEFNEEEASTEPDMYIFSFAVGFRWNQKIDQNEEKKHAIRISFTNGNFPTLNVENDKTDIYKYSPEQVSFNLNTQSLIANKEYKLLQNKGSTFDWTVLRTFTFDSNQNIPVELRITEPGNHNFKYQVVMSDKLFFGTNIINVHINTVTKPTFDLVLSKNAIDQGENLAFNIKINGQSNSYLVIFSILGGDSFEKKFTANTLTQDSLETSNYDPDTYHFNIEIVDEDKNYEPIQSDYYEFTVSSISMFELENVQISNVMVKKSKFTVSGTYKISPANDFQIKVQFENEIPMTYSIVNPKTQDNFEFTLDVPEKDANKYDVHIYGYNPSTMQSTVKVDKRVSITETPEIVLDEVPEVKIFQHEESFTIKYHVVDDTTGNISYNLFDSESPLEEYNQSSKSFEKIIKIPSNKDAGPYQILFTVTDEFGVPSTMKFEFTIKNPPKIESVALDNDLVPARGTMTATVDFTNKDLGRDLFIIAYIDNEVDSMGAVFSAGDSESDIVTIRSGRYVGRKTLTVFVSEYDYDTFKNIELDNIDSYLPKYSNSNKVNKTIIFTDKPELSFNPPSNRIYSTTEKIPLYLVITDNTRGNISYSIDNDSNLGYTQDLTEYVNDGNEKKIGKPVELPIPSTLTYGKEYTMKIKIIDEFNLESAEKNFTFSIKHVPSIDESNSIVPSKMERNKEIELKIVINDKDIGKNLYVYYCFNDETYQKFGETSSKGINKPVSVVKKIKISVNAGENQIISFYVIDNEKEIESGNAKSKVFTKPVTITPNGPEIVEYSLPQKSFNDKDSISVTLKIKGELDGDAHFELNGTEIYTAPFTLSDLNPTFTFPIKTYSYGNKELVFYLTYGENQRSGYQNSYIRKKEI
ncbi:hypothetical protein TVAG_430290 [Trichomonas vaginalis G3]|uniref:Bap-like n=1 Tax=Trichomonas vaginalis (strain ATCC PRA-98 / G3) TaxID=412133 RepID=A2E355_TRIV3|nr:hypothetical protein TVAGG3_1018450 [Trichomonas vaginalis G3]EAY12865.1 hypothetical protein TVAG_430290 [Trichomonas vaginalis G3]KAI5491970.1 hypothetical protein TVAGG3_1018450 [Trichomonas vaginalis G3]|eukprot:XP_001325088.1 hypothetical protein [Trichomonas vaginalis G3]